MRLFLKNGRSLSKKNIPKLGINIYSKNNIKLRKTLFKSKDSITNAFLRPRNQSIKKYEIIKKDYLDNKLNSNKNNLNNKLSKTIETKSKINFDIIDSDSNSNLNKNRSNKLLYKTIDIQKDNENKIRKNNILKNMKKRNSVYAKEYLNLKSIYGLLPKTPKYHKKNSLNNTPTLTETFFTSIPIESNTIKNFKSIENKSKRNSINSLLTIIPKLKIKRNYYEKIQLKELKEQIHQFEISKNFESNEKIIKSNLLSPEKFINQKYTKKIDNKTRIKINTDAKPKLNIKKLGHPIQHFKSNESKYLYKIINNLETESEKYKNNVKNIKYYYKYNKTERLLKNILNGNDLWNTDVDNYIKGTAKDYRKDLGEFTFYRGKGIFTGHLADIIKNEKLLAKMLLNELFEE